MKCFVVLLCIAYAFAVDPVSHKKEHKAHYKKRVPTADYKDLDDGKLRIYVHPIKNSGSSDSVTCSLTALCEAEAGWDYVAAENKCHKLVAQTTNNCKDGEQIEPIQTNKRLFNWIHPNDKICVKAALSDVVFEKTYSSGLSSGEVYDVDGNAKLNVAAALSIPLKFKCESGDDAVYIRKIQYKNGVKVYQANVMTVFDSKATCNTANMHMEEVGKNCPVEFCEDGWEYVAEDKICKKILTATDCEAGAKQVYYGTSPYSWIHPNDPNWCVKPASAIKNKCVGSDFNYDPATKSCTVCKAPIGGPKPYGHSPCALYYAADVSNKKNSLGYDEGDDCKATEGPDYHTCARHAVSGYAKCCHQDVTVSFKVGIENPAPNVKEIYNWGKK